MSDTRERDLGMLATLVKYPHVYSMYSDEFSIRKMDLYPIAAYLLAQLGALHRQYHRFPTHKELKRYLQITLDRAGDKIPDNIKEQTFKDARAVYYEEVTPLSQDMLAEYLYERRIGGVTESLTADPKPDENRFDRIEVAQQELSRLSLIKASKVGNEARFIQPLHPTIINHPKRALKDVYRGVTIPTGMKQTDKILSGGFRAGTMGFILAPVGKGKTLWLIQLMINAVLNKHRGVYYAMDNTSIDLVERSLGRWGNTPISKGWEETAWARYLSEVTRARFGRHWKKWAYSYLNIAVRLTGEVGWRDIWRDCIELEHLYRPLDKKYNPDRDPKRWGMVDFVVIDYGDHLKPSEKKSSQYDTMARCFADMTNLAKELGIAVATGTQTHRDALLSDDIDLNNIADCYPKTWTADWVVCMCQNAQEEREGRCRMKWAKLRRVKARHQVFCHVDYDYMTFTEDPERKPEYAPSAKESAPRQQKKKEKFKQLGTFKEDNTKRKSKAMVELASGVIVSKKTGKRVNPAKIAVDNDE